MEDSRNIIKAIDALTLKAGGEVVDSKNIVEALDYLRMAFTNRAITDDEVEEIVENYLIEHPISPSTITSAVNSYLQNNPIDVSLLTLESIDDGNGNVTVQVKTN